MTEAETSPIKFTRRQLLRLVVSGVIVTSGGSATIDGAVQLLRLVDQRAGETSRLAEEEYQKALIAKQQTGPENADPLTAVSSRLELRKEIYRTVDQQTMSQYVGRYLSRLSELIGGGVITLGGLSDFHNEARKISQI